MKTSLGDLTVSIFDDIDEPYLDFDMLEVSDQRLSMHNGFQADRIAQTSA